MKLAAKALISNNYLSLALVIFICITLLPCFGISSFKFRPLPTPPKASIKAGTAIVIKKPTDVVSLYLNGKLMTNIGNDYVLGALSIYGNEKSFVSGVWRGKSKKSFLAKIFGTDVNEYFFHPIDIVKVPLKKAPKLRFPARVKKNVLQGDKKKKQAEYQRRKAITKTSKGQMTDFCLKAPIKSKIVSSFASPRTIASRESYYHSGVDLRARKGVAIKAMSPGRVVLAEHMIVPGKIVVLDHGSNFFSVYMHLSKINVKVNQIIKKQEVIGLSGATGRVEASHLHWEVHWKGIPLNPFSLLQALKQVCDQA